MITVLESIMRHLDLLTIQGRDAERMAAIKSMVRDLINAIKSAEKEDTP